ncbi:hypothetical protein CC79DRAFT_1313010 [Sarocladium strictum]
MTREVARRSCWTCKRRKIGCDRSLPHCLNCKRSGRECHGYDLRLVWPCQPDGRRKLGEVFHRPSLPSDQEVVPQHYGVQFLNVTSEDIVLFATEQTLSQIVSRPSFLRPQRSLPLKSDLQGREAALLSYYESKIATLISSTQVQNGFRSELLPMALLSRDQASLALLNAMLAVSAFHCSGAEAALPYKSNAVKGLINSLRVECGHKLCTEGQSQVNPTDAQIAASMMLCVYSVFDETEGGWHLHLDGARFMLQNLASSYKNRFRPGFLLTWFLHHEVLACFTQPLRENPQELDLLQLLRSTEGDKTIIVGPSGCSLEVIEIIHQINRMRASTLRQGKDSKSPQEQMASQRLLLECRLNSLTQRIHPEEDSSISPSRRIRLLSTAELYRLAAYIYLLRVSPTTDYNTVRVFIVSRALSVLGNLDETTSLWPLFIIACEAVNDDARIQLLQILESMDVARGIGNIRVVRGIVEAFWKQVDLRADVSNGPTTSRLDSHAQPSVLSWGDLVHWETPVPWFV